MISDWRNVNNVSLSSLMDTDSLSKRLKSSPITNVFIGEKFDGRRYSLQLGKNGCYLVSRGKHGKSKGSDASKDNDYVNLTPCTWMIKLSMLLKEMGKSIVLDGELVLEGKRSTASGVGRKGVNKGYKAFDILMLDGETLISNNFSFAERRFLLEEEIAFMRNYSEEISIEGVVKFDYFNSENLARYFERIKIDGVEGFVLKFGDSKKYSRWGYKIKSEDNEDAFIVSVHEAKKHKLGIVTKTGFVGTVGLAQIREDGGQTDIIAFTGIEKSLKCRMDDYAAIEKLKGRVVEFKHLGWDGNRFSFPRFVRMRDDKEMNECKFKR